MVEHVPIVAQLEPSLLTWRPPRPCLDFLVCGPARAPVILSETGSETPSYAVLAGSRALRLCARARTVNFVDHEKWDCQSFCIDDLTKFLMLNMHEALLPSEKYLLLQDACIEGGGGGGRVPNVRVPMRVGTY